MASLFLVCHGCKTGRFIPKDQREAQAQSFRRAHRYCGTGRHWADKDAWDALKAEGYKEVGYPEPDQPGRDTSRWDSGDC